MNKGINSQVEIDLLGKFEEKFNIPSRLLLFCFILTLFLWLCSYTRHILFQSNVYDLGIFDQWFWLLSKGYPPISSTTKVHVLSDHGAWVIYIFSFLYKLSANINWLFFTQALSLSFTALPIWLIAKKNNLNQSMCWFVCGLWWLQPVVFNVNLFDFHPEVWAMPALAGCYLAAKKNNIVLWLILALFVIGCRDGLILVTAGIGIESVIRKKWKLAITAIGVSVGWFIFISRWLFPFLKQYSDGAIGATESIMSNLLYGFLTSPIQELNKIDLSGGIIYLLLISIAFIPIWTKNSLTTLAGTIPLLMLNFAADNPSFRTLIHQYNLPIALIGVIAAIEGLSIRRVSKVPINKLVWISICWFALAKPYFFTGPYLARLPQLNSIYNAISMVPKEANVLTTSYIAPHLSHRRKIMYPKTNSLNKTPLKDFDVILLNPVDPGWGSSKKLQNKILKSARESGWSCLQLKNSLNFCKK